MICSCSTQYLLDSPVLLKQFGVSQSLIGAKASTIKTTTAIPAIVPADFFPILAVVSHDKTFSNENSHANKYGNKEIESHNQNIVCENIVCENIVCEIAICIPIIMTIPFRCAPRHQRE